MPARIGLPELGPDLARWAGGSHDRPVGAVLDCLGDVSMTQHGHHHDHEPGGDAPTGDDRFSEAVWDQRYAERGALWSGQPNPQLVAEADRLPAGTALDAGCGEGADAIWLAERGWQVTAVDISTVALRRGAAHAAELGAELAGRITWQQQDLLTWGPPQRYDLVSAQFMQLPSERRAAFFARLGAGVAPGGTLLIVGHSPTDLNTTVPRPPLPELFFTATEVAATFDPSVWTIVVGEARPRQAHDPDGQPVTVHDEVIAARRN
jgi:SAM-dependent methyltransferase